MWEVEGETIAYTVRNDATMTAILIGCFVVVVIWLRGLVGSKVSSNEGGNRLSTHPVVGLLMLAFTSLQIALLQSQDVWIHLAIIAGYFVVRGMLYTMINRVFFDGRKNLQLIQSLLIITAAEGVALYPIVLLKAYFQLSIENLAIYVLSIIVIVKLLTFYKCYTIFFRRMALVLQFILYLCALEIVPLMALLVSLGLAGNNIAVK